MLAPVRQPDLNCMQLVFYVDVDYCRIIIILAGYLEIFFFLFSSFSLMLFAIGVAITGETNL